MIIKDVPSIKIYLFRLIVIAFAGFVYALGISLFIIPNQFLSGGIGGISLIIYELTGFSPSISIILLNLPVFIAGYKTIDKHFIFSSLVGMLAFSFSMTLTKGLIGALYVPSEILATIYGGVFTGIGMGLAFKSRGSFGGTDVLSAILKRKKNMNMGSTLFFFNLIIVGLASIIFEPYKGMYSLVGMFIGSAVVDKLIAGFEKRISVFIVSSEHGAIISIYIAKTEGQQFYMGKAPITRRMSL
jgi:uncharacterized membrane-anchored protein YitT (DUF2179 family)